MIPQTRLPYAQRSSPVVRLANAAGAALRRLGLKPLHLDRDRLIDEACRRDGLDDFGDIDIIEPLDVLLDSLERDAALTLVGRVVARFHVARILHQRLRLENERRLHPGIAGERVRPPLFITGMPRSGSTFLHHLLANDPAARSTRAWESMHPSPPPERETYETDSRIGLARRQIAGFRMLAPQFDAIHHLDAQLPQECLEVLSYAFRSAVFETMYSVDGYSRWLERSGMTDAYAMHKRVLQHLQWRCPAHRWVLKAPAHVFHLQELIQTYPDAMIVHTHREPLEVLGSVASLTATLRGAFSDDIDPHAIGRETSQRWGRAATIAVQTRDDTSIDGDRFFDVRYEDLVRDPLTVVGRIYEYFELELTASVERRMRSHLNGVAGRRRKRRPHRYSLEAFGLDRRREHERYETYRRRFGIGSRRRRTTIAPQAETTLRPGAEIYGDAR